MPYWILRYRAGGQPPTGDLDTVARDPKVRLVDQTGARLALIDAPADEVARLQALLPGWRIEREREFELPDTWPGGRSGMRSA